MRTVKLTLAYDGTDFVGWQRQARGRSVQATLEAALATIEGGPVRVVGAGRTDAGVHALGQVAAARLRRQIDLAALPRALNALLPDDVRVLEAEEVDASFDPRRSARWKCYRYLISTAPVLSPFERRYVLHVPQPLAVDLMIVAAARFIGCHDFAAYRAAGSSVHTTLRTVRSSDLFTIGARIQYEVIGDGFLRYQVRGMVGTLLEVGRGRFAPDEVIQILASKDRSRAGPTVPPQGLYLVRVDYEDRSGVDSGERRA